MRQIFVNLKRFDIPRNRGGLCPENNPITWIESVIKQTIDLGLGQLPHLSLTYLLPEGLIHAGQSILSSFPDELKNGMAIGCQGVHWEDIQPGKNFGAFTTSLPASAAKALGSQWAIIGHSEERKSKMSIIHEFDTSIDKDEVALLRARQAVNHLIGREVGFGLAAGLKVLLCVGETEDERGNGSFDNQKPRIKSVLKEQLLEGLSVVAESGDLESVVIGYEPVWAIGPGKISPGKDYIAYVSSMIKEIIRETKKGELSVVYGGGLKEENAGMIASIPTIDGGLVALTRFSGEIGFYVQDLKAIVDQYLASDRK